MPSPKCPKCGRRGKRDNQTDEDLFWCKWCRMLYDDDPDDGGDFRNDPTRRVTQ